MRYNSTGCSSYYSSCYCSYYNTSENKTLTIRICIYYRIVVTINIPVIAISCRIFGEKSTVYGVIVPCHKVIESCFGVIPVTGITERIINGFGFCDNNAESIIGITVYNIFFAVDECDNIAVTVVKIGITIIADYSGNIIDTIDIFGCLLAVFVNFKHYMISGIVEIFLGITVHILADADSVAVVTESDGLIAHICDNYLILRVKFIYLTES